MFDNPYKDESMNYWLKDIQQLHPKAQQNSSPLLDTKPTTLKATINLIENIADTDHLPRRIKCGLIWLHELLTQQHTHTPDHPESAQYVVDIFQLDATLLAVAETGGTAYAR